MSSGHQAGRDKLNGGRELRTIQGCIPNRYLNMLAHLIILTSILAQLARAPALQDLQEGGRRFESAIYFKLPFSISVLHQILVLKRQVRLLQGQQ